LKEVKEEEGEKTKKASPSLMESNFLTE